MAFGRLLVGIGLVGLGYMMLKAPQQPETREGRFVRRVARSDGLVMEAARIAAERASRDDIREFAQSMRDEHASLGSQLGAAALAAKLPRPSRSLGEVERERIDGLAGSEDFDAAFIRLEIAEHLKLLTIVSDYASEGSDPALVSFAEDWMPKLADHYEHARIIQRDLRGTTR